MKKILITGSTGLVGSEAVDYFREKGWEVVGIDNNNRAQFFHTPDKFPELIMDIRDLGALMQLFDEHKFDAIIHAAAQPSHDYSSTHVLEDFSVNAMGTLALLEATRSYCPDAVFVHCSTDKIYGVGMGELKVSDETTPIRVPMSAFGVSKLAADYYAQEYAAQGWVKTGIFRMGCITGRRHEGAELHGFLAYLTKCIKEGLTYKIFGFAGNQTRDQIHAYDLVSAFHQFIEKPNTGAVYNMGGGLERAKTLMEFADLISAKLGKPFNYEFHEQRFADRFYDVHDVSKFRKDYPAWDYKYSLDDIISDLCAS